MLISRFRKLIICCIMVCLMAVMLCSCQKSSAVSATVVAEATSAAFDSATITPETTTEETQPVGTTESTKATKAVVETTEETTEETTSEVIETTPEPTTVPETTQETTPEPTTVQETTPEPTTVPETTPAPTEPETAPLSYEERMSLMNSRILQDMPGIVCWGDSLTMGYGGLGVSYPQVLKNLMTEKLTDLVPVYNNGVCMETIQTILARAGKVTLEVAEDNTIRSDVAPSDLKLRVPGDWYLNLGGADSPGLNPVIINGVTGTLYSNDDSEDYHDFYFIRDVEGEPIWIPEGTRVTTYGAYGYPGCVNIIFMGENGYYSSPQHFVDQTKAFVDALDNDRYLVIGLTTGDNNSRLEIDNLMEATFGAKYIRSRQELCDKGKMYLNMPEEDGDWFNKENGIVYGSFMSDNIHLNYLGYIALGYVVYDRMEALGYFDNIKSYISQYNY